MTLDWDEGQVLGNQILIASKSSRFLNLYFDSYHKYNRTLWYYNAGYLPMDSILDKNPGSVHRVKGEFGIDATVVCPKVYRIYYPNQQKEFLTIHLVIRGNEISFKDWFFGPNKPLVKKFDKKTSKI